MAHITYILILSLLLLLRSYTLVVLECSSTSISSHAQILHELTSIYITLIESLLGGLIVVTILVTNKSSASLFSQKISIRYRAIVSNLVILLNLWSLLLFIDAIWLTIHSGLYSGVHISTTTTSSTSSSTSTSSLPQEPGTSSMYPL